MPVSRRGTRESSTSIPAPARAGIAEEQQASPAAPMSWIPTTAPVAIASRQASSSSFSVKGSPTWTVGRRSSAPSSKTPEATGAPGGPEDAARLAEPHAHDVHQRVALILRGKGHLAADVGDAEAVVVPGDAGHHAADQVAGLRVLGIAEAERVERRDGAGGPPGDVPAGPPPPPRGRP